MKLTVTIPMNLPSVANLREHWAVKAKRTKIQRHIARFILGAALRRVHPEWPTRKVCVTITRVGSRKLDDDNLASAAKGVRDGIADALHVNDGDIDHVRWVYKQRTLKTSKRDIVLPGGRVEISVVELAR